MAVTEATGSKVTVGGKTYELLGYDANGSKVYQDAEILAEQAAKENASADQDKATQPENGQEAVENSENRDKMKIGMQFFAEKTQHANERIEQRNLPETGVDDALVNPLYKGEVIVDDAGRKSVKYIGKDITVVLNPDTGEVITAWKTGSRIRRKYGGD